MDFEEKFSISRKLQDYHYFFRAFWDLCSIQMTEDDSHIPTAAVNFDKTGECIGLTINTNFWNSLNDDTKLFLLCHEMLHVLLDHSKRFLEYYGTPDMMRMNVAADVVINELLVNSFNFVRSELTEKLSKDGCWLDTVFKDDPNILENQSTEYYFNKLESKMKTQYFAIDAHKILSDDEVKQLQKTLVESGVLDKIDDDFVEKVSKSVDGKEANKPGGLLAGTGSGTWARINLKRILKRKWETIVKRWVSNQPVYDAFMQERWERIKPLYSELFSDGKFQLPSNNLIIDNQIKKNRLDVHFFLDTSGSCYHLKDRFIKAAMSLDPKRFNVRLFSFDDAVKEVDIKKQQIYGGGGTCFAIIEQKVQEIMKKERRPYPHAVWLITDGFGTNVSPAKPDRWYWFLSEDCRTYIPKTSKVFMLKDFE